MDLEKSIEASIAAIISLQQEKSRIFLEKAIQKTYDTFMRGGKILLAGNGGSLCDALHFAEECTGFFASRTRKALPAIVLGGDAGHLTCVANDQDFSQVFVRGVEAFGKEGDLFFALSTSGNSKNVLLALDKAKTLGLFSIAFLGKNGGHMHGLADLELIISHTLTAKIQEAHMTALHLIIEGVEAKWL